MLIGTTLETGNADAGSLAPPAQTMGRETAQGLTAFDAAGQVTPGLAESWIVTDDGLSAIFRIRRARWPDGREVTGEQVADSLNGALERSSRNSLKPLLTAVDTVVGMTGRVVEIRLKTPRPYLLQLLAQPELGIKRNGFGSGPWRIADRGRARSLLLRPAPDVAAEGDPEAPADPRRVTVRADRSARAVTSFAMQRADLVLGGTFVDWPLVAAADLPEAAIRVDPAEGLFGLAVLPRAPFLRDATSREALAMAIDRVALVTLFGAQRWKVADRLLPAQLDSSLPPTAPAWADLDMPSRRALAANTVSRWKAANGAIAPLRIAMPEGPGARLLLAQIRADWRRIGIEARAVPQRAEADLRLIDAVSPNTSANWYLTSTGCDAGLPCNEAGQQALLASRNAPTLALRSAAIAQADAAYATTQGFIPLAKPLRWSLVAPALTGFRENVFAVHPFAELRRNAPN